MDCLEVQALISAAHDGEAVDATALADARAHCKHCADCTAFVEGLTLISKVPAPKVPDSVIAATLAAVAAAAEERANAERFEAMQREVDLLAAADALPPAPEPEPQTAAKSALTLNEFVERRPAWMRRVPALPGWVARAGQRFADLNDSVKWAGIGAAAALAATALIAFVIVGIGPQAPTADLSTSGAGTESATVSGTGMYGYNSKSSTGGKPTAPTAPVVTSAPDYVGYNSRVYTPGALLADPNTATPTIGAVKTAFATGGGIVDAPVFASPLKDGSIVIAGPDGYRLYSPVVRRYASKRYQLVAGNALERFGLWPSLPTRFTPPQSTDGSPSFTAAATDSLGVSVFAASGQPVTAGFAVAPGTGASDPAAGNPNWTWWEPIDQ